MTGSRTRLTGLDGRRPGPRRCLTRASLTGRRQLPMSLSKIRGEDKRRRPVADKLTKCRLPVSAGLTSGRLMGPDSLPARFNFELTDGLEDTEMLLGMMHGAITSRDLSHCFYYGQSAAHARFENIRSPCNGTATERRLRT